MTIVFTRPLKVLPLLTRWARLIYLSTALCQGVNAQDANHNAPSFSELAQCIQALSIQAPRTQANATLPHSSTTRSTPLSVLSWNIYKGKKPGWQTDLKRLTKNADIVLLQESVFSDPMTQPNSTKFYWSFSEGYTTSKYRSGLITATRAQPDIVCSLPEKEPWLKSPKMTMFTRIPLPNTNRWLLVVNSHAINFSVRTKSYKAQLEAIHQVLRSHLY